MGRSIALSLYLALLVLPAMVHLANKITTDTGGIISRFAPLIVVLIMAVGLYGFVFRQPIFKSGLWKCIFWLLVLLSLSCLATIAYFIWATHTITSPAGCWAIVIALALLPAEVGLFRYAYLSPAIWRDCENTT